MRRVEERGLPGMCFPRWLTQGARLCLVGLLCALPCQAVELVLYTEENPPLNFSEDGDPTGFSTEVIEATAARTGDQVQILLEPWTRGYNKALNEANVGLFSTARIELREHSFQWVGPLMRTLNRFYTLKGSGIRITSLEEAASAGQLALPRQWYTHEYLRNKGFTNLYTVTTPEKMMQMFSKQRVSLLAANDVQLPELLQRVGMSEDQLEPQFVFLEHESYLVFSLATDAEVVQRWQAALDSLKRDGSFAAIYQRWFPGRSVPPRLLEVDGAQNRK